MYKIRYTQPNSSRKMNYLIYYKKETIELILLIKEIIKELPEEIKQSIIYKVLYNYNKDLTWLYHK